MRRAAGLAGVLLLAVFGVHRVARAEIARAVALAPNAGKRAADLERLPLPPELAARGGFVLETPVRAPEALLTSWVVPAAGVPTQGTVVLLHGVRLDKRSVAPLAPALVDAGFRVVLVDLRGHGESTGKYLTYGSLEARDVIQVLDALGARVPLGPVGVFGYSYGGAVAVMTGALDPRVRAVVAASPFASLRSVMVDYERKYLPAPLSLVPDAWFQGAVDDAAKLAGFDPDRSTTLALAPRSQEPVLLIHGLADTQVSPNHSRALDAALGGRAELRLLPGETHESILLDRSGRVRAATTAWFGRWLGR